MWKYWTNLTAQSSSEHHQKKMSSHLKRDRKDSLGMGYAICILCSTDLVEVISYNLPNSRPLQPNAVHVVVRYFHNLLQAEHPRLVCRGQLVHGHRA